MKRLNIAIDPGFDGMKVIANGKAFKFPFSIIETDERKMSDYFLRDDFMRYRSKIGTSYRLGSYARELAYEGKLIDESFYTDRRFLLDEFQVGIDTAIALAIVNTGLYEKQNDLDIRVNVALPHELRQQYAPAVIGVCAGRHEFALQIGPESEKRFDFTIEQEDVMTISQAVAAILGETSDEKGNVDKRKAGYIMQGPSLVLDIGYYTAGMLVITRGGSIDDSKAESDTNYAMKNVNMRIAKAIKDIRPDLQHYSVEHLVSKDNGIIRFLKDGKAGTVDLKKLREEKAKEVCSEFITYINKKYNNLVDFNYVIVTGGTGAVYFDQLKEYYVSTGLFDTEHFVLTNSKLYDEEHSIEFAIAVGAFKGLLGRQQAQA